MRFLVYYDLYGTTAYSYPEGYTEDNYYKYKWESVNDSIVKIDGDATKVNVKLTAVSAGKTSVKCTITSVDGEMEPVTKVVNVKVIDVSGEYEWTGNEDSASSGITRLYLKLNDNGTAEFIESNGVMTESTSGTYEYRNGIITYTKVNFNDDNKTAYDGHEPTVEFLLSDSGKLELLVDGEKYTLSKKEVKKGDSSEDNPQTGIISKEKFIYLTLLIFLCALIVVGKHTRFSKHS